MYVNKLLRAVSQTFLALSQENLFVPFVRILRKKTRLYIYKVYKVFITIALISMSGAI